MAFLRLLKRFTASGGTTGLCKPDNSQLTARSPENIKRVSDFFEETPRFSIKKAMQKLDLSFSTIWRILRFDLHWKPYKLHMTNQLTPENRMARENFCSWILARTDVDSFLQKVIWTNEK
jgi:hypothetical protein